MREYQCSEISNQEKKASFTFRDKFNLGVSGHGYTKFNTI